MDYFAILMEFFTFIRNHKEEDMEIKLDYDGADWTLEGEWHEPIPGDYDTPGERGWFEVESVEVSNPNITAWIDKNVLQILSGLATEQMEDEL